MEIKNKAIMENLIEKKRIMQIDKKGVRESADLKVLIHHQLQVENHT